MRLLAHVRLIAIHLCKPLFRLQLPKRAHPVAAVDFGVRTLDLECEPLNCAVSAVTDAMFYGPISMSPTDPWGTRRRSMLALMGVFPSRTSWTNQRSFLWSTFTPAGSIWS
ncbi:hypothetical protein HDG33_003784 [Paraburkholderia sp. Cpub6]|nr:hypothetical protein [Paraburkholderia sp. Cpub6]